MAKRASRGDFARTEVITARLTRTERVRVEQRAAAAGLTVSGWAGMVLAQGRVTVEAAPGPELHPALIAELKHIGNNVNQIARALNSSAPVAVRRMQAIFDQLLAVIAREQILASRARLPEADRSAPNGATHPQKGEQLPGGVRLHPP